MHLSHILKAIANGGQPTLTGVSLTKEEAAAIRAALDEKKARIDAYYSDNVECRIVK